MKREILAVKNLNAYCPQSSGGAPIKLLEDINLVMRQNDILGLVGETGTGKSILVNALGRNLSLPLWSEADKLSITLKKNTIDLLEKDDESMRKIWGKGIAFIPSNAKERLNPLLKIGRQLCNILEANLGMSNDEARVKILEIFKLVRMPDPEQNFHSYAHELSGGMAQRVLISIALAMSPQVLLADEPTMGLDVTIQKQVLDLLAEIIETLGSSVILATRDLGIVANYCNRVAVMHAGRIVELNTVQQFFQNPLHPYSQYLLNAAFASHDETSQIDFNKLRNVAVNGPPGESDCSFFKHCHLADETCFSSITAETVFSSDQSVRCHKTESLKPLN